MDDDAADPDASLLPDLAAHRVLDGLAGLDEAGQGAVPVGRPAALATQQHALAVGRDDGDNHGGISAWEAHVGDAVARVTVGAGLGLGAAGQVRGRADALVARLDGEVDVATAGAEAVAGIPVDKGAGLGQDSG